MILNQELYGRITKEATCCPRLRMHHDLHDSENEDSQRKPNVLLPGTKTAILHHIDTSEMFVRIYGSAIERFHDE